MMTSQLQDTSTSSRAATAGVTRPFQTPVRGHAFAARTDGATEPVPGQLARLVREPANPADRYAVSVWVAGRAGRWRIGYLDRLIAARLAPRLDAGATIAARIDGWTPEPDGRWRRPLLVLLPDDGNGSDPKDTFTPPKSEAGEEPTSATTSITPNRDEVHKAPKLWGRPPGVSRRVVHPA